MSTIETTTGMTVCMSVNWFKEKPFQDWFNSRLGKGLATWNPAAQLLGYVDPKECRDLASMIEEVLHSNVISGSNTNIFDIKHAEESPENRLARVTLEELINIFESGAEKVGLQHAALPQLAQELLCNVIDAPMFTEIGNSGIGPDEEKSQNCRIAAAKAKLNKLYDIMISIPDNDDMATYCDCFVGVDPGLSGEGTDSDMPEEYWNQIVDHVQKLYRGPNDGMHIVAWLKPAS